MSPCARVLRNPPAALHHDYGHHNPRVTARRSQRPRTARANSRLASARASNLHRMWSALRESSRGSVSGGRVRWKSLSNSTSNSQRRTAVRARSTRLPRRAAGFRNNRHSATNATAGPKASSSSGCVSNATTPALGGPAISDYDVQYRSDGGTTFTDHPHTGTGTTATITGLTAGTSYEVQVRAQATGRPRARGSTGTSASNSPATGAPTITGTAQVGETLTAVTDGIADADGLTSPGYSYQWIAANTDIAGANGSSYTPVDDDVARPSRCGVSFTDDANNVETLTSAATAVVAAKPNSPTTGAPTITGTAQVGQTLEAVTDDIADADGLANATFSYQWLADDTDIAGATGSTYTLTDSEESKAITVQVSFTDDAGNDEALTSAATAAVAGAQPTEAPAKPRDLSATASHDSVTLTWEDPGDDTITGYVILRRVRVNNTGGDFSELVADTGTAATTYTDDTVAAGTTYTYRIKAINGAGTSERSRWFHIDIPAAPVPDKPTGLEATASHDSVTLTWEDPGDDSITGYVILRRLRYDDPSGHFDELVADTGTAATTYTDDTVKANTHYTYRIKAINEHGGVSERSRWFHIQTQEAP